MTRNVPPVTTALLERALAVPQASSAPMDLRGSIAAAIRLTQQRPAPLDRRITAIGVLPRPVRLAMAALLVLALLAGIAAVGAQLLR